jgi:hypothetical protein
MNYACPKCKSTSLRVVVSMWMDLVQGGDLYLDEDGPQTAICDSDQEWDQQSPMKCRDCDFNGVVAQFNQGGTE